MTGLRDLPGVEAEGLQGIPGNGGIWAMQGCVVAQVTGTGVWKDVYAVIGWRRWASGISEYFNILKEAGGREAKLLKAGLESSLGKMPGSSSCPYRDRGKGKWKRPAHASVWG